MKKPEKDDWELTPEQERRLHESLRDLTDRTRWIIADAMFGKGCWLIWNASDDTSLMYWTRKPRGRPKQELLTKSITVFKRKEHAEAMLAVLKRDREYKRDGVLLECKVSKDGSKVVKIGRPEPQSGT